MEYKAYKNGAVLGYPFGNTGAEEILKHMHAYQNSYIKIRSIETKFSFKIKKKNIEIHQER